MPLRLVQLFLLIFIFAAVSVTARAAAPAAADLPNFHAVAPGIWRGAAPSAVGLKELKAMGIDTVVDLRIAPKTVKKEHALVTSLGMSWLNLPMSGDPPTQKQVTTLMALLRQAPQRKIFVHCQHGADRTGCMIGIYRVSEQSWLFDRTFAEMRKYGFNPHWTKLKDAVSSRARA